MDERKVLSLADFGDARTIIPDLGLGEKREIILELCRILAPLTGASRCEEMMAAVNQREALGSTAEPPGIAFPHARLPFVERPCFALARLNEPVVWETSRQVKVRLVFLMATPLEDASMYLKLLSGIGRVGRSPQIFQSLLNARDRDVILEQLRSINVR